MWHSNAAQHGSGLHTTLLPGRIGVLHKCVQCKLFNFFSSKQQQMLNFSFRSPPIVWNPGAVAHKKGKKVGLK